MNLRSLTLSIFLLPSAAFSQSEIKIIFPSLQQEDSAASQEKTNQNSQEKSQDSKDQTKPEEPKSETTKKNPSIGGFEIPVFDAASDTVQWDGHVWKVDNNRLFRARFEKYLNAPASEISDYEPYNKLISSIMDILSAGNISANNLDEAFRLLPKAATFDVDANISDSIANQVLRAWQSQRQVNRIASANKSLEEDRKRHEWNVKISSQKSGLITAPKSTAGSAEYAREQEIQRATRMQPDSQRLVEVNALIKSNQAKSELSEIQSKIEFQSLIVQLFLQRRFRHTLIASRFYRSIFKDGDDKLRLGDRAKSLFARVADIPPTINSIDAIANEAIRDVRESVKSVTFLLSKDELDSASTRLGEAFAIGEHLQEIQQFPREDRQRVLTFTRNANQLLSALEVKDYTRAEQITLELQKLAHDFDPTKPMTAVQTARNVSRMHLGRAKNAALSGDSKTVESELRAATEIWPNNPELTNASEQIFDKSDVQKQAINEFERLLSQKNYRQIYSDKLRFIAATAIYPEKQKDLQEVLERMGTIEGIAIKAKEIAQRGDPAGAWETVEAAQKEFPGDSELQQLRADLTTQAADFVQSLNQATEYEKKGQPGSSLAWYLKARKKYPASQFAKEGIQRLSQQILPESK
jgi:hypothetical protein